ncbi:MAG TPA: hypothetical protein VKV26_14540 [Dehalococcoidia bacterium]|nr:hypothetical protein [Dehalococcoidia bacterium]
MARRDATALGIDEPRQASHYGAPRRAALSVLILLHIAAVLVWLLPASQARSAVQGVSDRYINFAGIWQSWGMFAPEPANLNLYIHAQIRYSDGSKRDWSFPRMDQLDFVTRYRLERFRKYEEYAHLDAYAAIWPDLARWVARQNVGNPANPPVLVTLIRSWWEVPPPPANGDISHDPPHAWSSYQFFQQPISRSDLQ